MPALSRAELNSQDIIREIGVVKMRRNTSINAEAYGTATSMCIGKPAYETKPAAERAQGRHGRQAYRCKFCKCWHNGGR